MTNQFYICQSLLNIWISYYICSIVDEVLELTKEEENALDGKNGETLALAYRTLVAIGEASGADRLIPIKWAHLSGVNYNTIGDAGRDFLSHLSQDAKFKVRTTVNPMGFDFDSVGNYGLEDEFIEKQLSIKNSYEKMGVIPSFSCIPYEIFDVPEKGSQVSFAESNAAIFANSFSGLLTNKEGAFSALASALTGKSPFSDLRDEERRPNLTIHMKVESNDELTNGMLGYFAGKVAGSSVALSGVGKLDRRSCKSLCAGMGTSGTCGMFTFGEEEGEKIDFDKKEMQKIQDELDTSEGGDLIALGSPQLGLEEIGDLAAMLKGRSFQKRCMIFCPRGIKKQITDLGYTKEIEHAGGEILYDCCTCLSPLINNKEIDSVITNSVKGAYYLQTSNKVGVHLKNLKKIIQEDTK